MQAEVGKGVGYDRKGKKSEEKMGEYVERRLRMTKMPEEKEAKIRK